MMDKLIFRIMSGIPGDESVDAPEVPEVPFAYNLQTILPAEQVEEITRSRDAIIADPKANIERLEELQRRCGLNLINLRDDYFLKQFIVAIVTNIYILLIPNYRIQERGESSSGRVSAKTRALWKYEDRLLKNYEEYLGLIEKFLDLFLDPGASEKFLADASLEKEYFHYFAVLAAASAAQLLSEHHDFNYRSRLIELNIKIMCTGRFSIMERKVITKKQQILVYNDVTAESVCEMITGLCKKIVDMKFRVPPNAIRLFKYFQESMFIKASDFIKGLTAKRAIGLPDKCRKKKFQMANLQTLEEVRDKYKKKTDKQIKNLYRKFWTFMHENDQHDDWLTWYQPLFCKMVAQIFHKMEYRQNKFDVLWINIFNATLLNESIFSKLRSEDLLTFLCKYMAIMWLAKKKIRQLVYFPGVSLHVCKFSNTIFNTPLTNREWELFFQSASLWIDSALEKYRGFKKLAARFYLNVVYNFLTKQHTFGRTEVLPLLSWIKHSQILVEQPWTNYYLIENDADSGNGHNMTTEQELQRRTRAYSLVNTMANRYPNGYVRYSMWICFFKTKYEGFINEALAEELGLQEFKVRRLVSLFDYPPCVFHRILVDNRDYFV